jgi:membrane protease YdiL (CAAX protease family)
LPATPQDRTAGDLRAVVIWAFVLFALTGAGALPFIYAGQSLEQSKEAGMASSFLLAGILLTAYAPMVAALFVALVVPGSGGLRRFLRQLVDGRAGAGWYLLVLLAPIAIVLAADGIYVLAGGAAPTAWFSVPQNFTTAAFWGPLVAGSLGEEPGWRGFALPRLGRRFGALSASILIGILWGTWHLWPALTPGGASQLSIANLMQTYVRMISTSILYAWMYNSTNGSLILTMVAHAAHNLAIDFIPIPGDTSVVPIIIALLYLAAAVAVVLLTDPTTLSSANSTVKKRLTE